MAVEIISIPSTVNYNGVEYRVTSIAKRAFSGNKTVKEIRILSEHITVIPASMILNTYDGALEKIYVDFSKITKIDEAGFNPSTQSNGNNPKTNSFYYYDAAQFIADGTSVKITCPDFSNCTYIGHAAFQGCNFDKIVVPGGLTHWGIQSFRRTTATEIVISDGIVSAPNYSFAESPNVTTIVIKGKPTAIGSDAFSTCRMVSSINIDLSVVKTIGSSAFANMGESVTEWNFTDIDLSSIESIGGKAFYKSKFGGDVVVPENVNISNASNLFEGCKITSLWVKGQLNTAIPGYFMGNTPVTWVRVDSNNLKSIGSSAFSCSKLEEIYIDLSSCTTVNESAFIFGTKYDSGQERVQWYNTNGEKVVNFSNVTTLGERAFASSNLGSATVIWPRALDKINDQVFRKANITGTAYINLKDGVTGSVPSYFLNGNKPDTIICGSGVTGFELDGRLTYPATVVFLGDLTTLSTDMFKSANSVMYAKSLPNDASAYGSNVTVHTITDGSVEYSLCGVVASVNLTDGTSATIGEVEHNYKAVMNEQLCPVGKVYVNTCIVCGLSYTEIDGVKVDSAPEHNFDCENEATIADIVYENGFASLGVYVYKCAGCEATHKDEAASAPVLFVINGFSSSDSGIMYNYTTNQKAIEEYLKYNYVSFGVVVAIGNVTSPLKADGILAEGVNGYASDLTDRGNDLYEIAVKGIPSEHLATQIVCCGYISDGENVYYMGATSLEDTATVVTLETVPALVPTSKEEY